MVRRARDAAAEAHVFLRVDLRHRALRRGLAVLRADGVLGVRLAHRHRRDRAEVLRAQVRAGGPRAVQHEQRALGEEHGPALAVRVRGRGEHRQPPHAHGIRGDDEDREDVLRERQVRVVLPRAEHGQNEVRGIGDRERDHAAVLQDDHPARCEREHGGDADAGDDVRGL